MDQPVCPACKAENAEDAAFCDQCGQHLNPPERAPEESPEGGCPACGGIVEDRRGGIGVCRSCGLELHAAEGEPPPRVPADAATASRLTAAILRGTSAGAPLEQAVAEACREVLGAASPSSGEPSGGGPEADELQPCPLCGAECAEDAPRCPGCGIWFHRLRAPQPCPRCERETAAEACECGAILTLPKLLNYLEPRVRAICARCKAPYAVAHAKCPDCGGGMISADRLKAFAAAERA
ncbi:MAG TPA: zinc ribbon domain-containing protein [Elusimicrobiota bacterium]|nr:zinc ribbon domain-containing protein [Elusimicrobiota bacterium]